MNQLLKRFLMETDLNRLKQFVESLEEFRLFPFPELDSRIDHLDVKLNSAGFDPWGLHPETLRKFVPMIYFLYKKYFRVETVGIENLPAGRVLFVGNHGGQIPIDAMMAGLALFMEGEPPRIPRAMVERWVPTVPFVSSLFTRIGAIVGDPINCRELLNHDQSVLVFPEGVRGSGKTFDERYQLQRFGTGFMRLAQETGSPIVPVAIIGTEETYPSLHNFKSFAKLIGAPYFPITPFFPLFGLFGLVPIPAKITVRFGKPLVFSGNAQDSEETVREKVQIVKDALQKEIHEGLEKRGDHIFSGAGK